MRALVVSLLVLGPIAAATTRAQVPQFDPGASLAFDSPSDVVSGLSRPESCQPHEETGWYISNIGDPSLADPITKAPLLDGFITRVARDGSVTLRWLTGLQNPRGLEIWQGRLYVADTNRVVVVHIGTGVVVDVLAAPRGVQEWNDPTLDRHGRALFVSDRAPGTTSGAIWRIDLRTRAVAKVVDVATNPNGVLADKGHLLYVDRLGHLFRHDLTSGKSQRFDLGPGLDAGTLDGIEREAHATYLVTDNQGHTLWRVRLDDERETFALERLSDDLATAYADLGYDPATRRVCIPTLAAGTGGHSAFFFDLP